MQNRQYSSISQDTTLSAGGISSTATSMTVASGTGSALMGGITLVTNDTFAVAIDPDTINEEIIFITSQSGDTFNITRGRANTTPVVHGAGATVRHVMSSDDLNWFNTTSPGTISTAKGDIVVATGSQAVDNLPVGANGQVLYADSTQTMGVKWAALPTVTFDLTLKANTGTTYTFISSDVNKLLTFSNAAAITATVPNGVFTVGQQINLQQIDAGQVTIVSDGTTVITGTGTKTRTQWSAATLICTATNTFTVIGDVI